MSKKAKRLPNMQRRPVRRKQPDTTSQIQAQSGSETTTYFIHGPRGIHAQQTDSGWQWMAQDGLGSVREVIDNANGVANTVNYDPFGNQIGHIGSPQTIFGYTGEPTDDLVYLRERYYNPQMGAFLSLDSYEGSHSDPMSLNGYAYAYGNPVNRSDPSGRSPIPTSAQGLNALMSQSPLAFANVMNAGMCYQDNECNIFQRFFGLCSTPTPTPMPCAMRDRNGVNVLAATAITESDGYGRLSQNDAAVAALMVMQLNTYIATNGANWRELGTWQNAGQSASTIIADPSQSRILDIATQIVNGYCNTPNDPLSLVNQAYPSIASNQCLQGIAGNPDARFEVSIDATRANEFRSDPDYPLQCVFEAAGADRAIVVGGVDITNARLAYQCAINEQAVINGDPNAITSALSAWQNHTCTPCTNVTEWWWRIPNDLGIEDRNRIGSQVGQQISPTQRYVKVTEGQRQSLVNQYRSFSYVASCT